MNYNNILAIDCASAACSACVLSAGKPISSLFINNGLTHSQTLLPAIEQVLKSSGICIEDISAIAITTGPGSFTGLKIATATAKGLAFTKNIPCIKVSSLTALAYALKSFNGIICTVLDARRNMLYNALFKAEKGKLLRLCEDRQISAEDLSAELAEFSEPIYVTGDGSNIVAKQLCDKDSNFIFMPAEQCFIKAEYVGMAAESFGETVMSEQLLPFYLRPPQAERERIEREKNKQKE